MKATLTLSALRPYQQKFIQDPSRVAACVSCTQIGKTFVCACWLIAGMWTCRCPHPGGWFAPSFSQVMKGHDTIEALAKAAGIYSRRGSKLTPHPVIALINGKRIEFRSWEASNARKGAEGIQGDTICRGVVDESGLLNPKAQGAISSRLSETLGPIRYIGNPGMVAGPWRKVCSLAETRAAKTGLGFYRWTWKDRRDAYLAAGDEVGARRYERFIDSERESLAPFEFRRLYEAAWTEDEAAVFTGVDAASHGLPLKTGKPGSRYSTGIDVGQQQDYFVLIAVNAATRRAEAMERFRGIPSPQQAARVQAFMGRFPGTALLEMNGPGVQLYPVLRKMGIKVKPFNTTHQSKNEIIMRLAGAISNGDIGMALMPPLQHELKAYRYERSGASLGAYRYGAPPGEHDDTVMSIAFAWHMAQRSAGVRVAAA